MCTTVGKKNNSHTRMATVFGSTTCVHTHLRLQVTPPACCAVVGMFQDPSFHSREAAHDQKVQANQYPPCPKMPAAQSDAPPSAGDPADPAALDGQVAPLVAARARRWQHAWGVWGRMPRRWGGVKVYAVEGAHCSAARVTMPVVVVCL